MDWLIPALGLGWLLFIGIGIVRGVREMPLGYSVKGGRMIRWISDWVCKDCGTQNTCPRKRTGLRCKNCKSDRGASIEFWHEQSKLPLGQRHRPGVPLSPELRRPAP
jgi:hypothetical protein